MGRLIVLDGLDASGKNTQSKILEEFLKEQNVNVKRVEYPNYASNSSALVKQYLNGEIYEDLFKVNPFAASSFYACDHYITFEKNWKNEYFKDYVIIADRYVSSNIVHQMVKLKESEWESFIGWIYDYEIKKLGLPKEDVLIYLDVEPEVSKKLMQKRNNVKDIHEKNFNYLKSCRRAALFAAEKLNWKVLKCSDEVEIFEISTIANKIKKLVLNII